MSIPSVVRPPDHLKKIHVLVADNDQRVLDLMASVLKHLGFYHVFLARDGFRAVDIMRQHGIDLIITDWELPPLQEDYSAGLPSNPVVCSEQWLPIPPKDGARFVKYVRMSKYSPNRFTAIIMLTGIGLQNHIEYARDAGVNEVILKPVGIENLCQRIINIIDRPRPFIVAEHYKGPCRRRENTPLPQHMERRKREIKVFKHAS